MPRRVSVAQPALALQQHQRRRRTARQTPTVATVRSTASSAPTRDAEQRAVGERVAEVGHAPPHHEAAERAGDRGDPDAAEERAQQEIIEHGAGPAPAIRRSAAGCRRRRRDLAGQIVARGRARGCRSRGRARRARPEQADVFRVAAHRLGLAGAADVPIEADHPVGRAP